MADIAVSIDAKGDISCPDATVPAGTQVTWPVTGGTISSITPGDPSPFRATPTVTRGQWSATVIASGQYTITDSAGKTRTPKISIVVPEVAKKY